MRALLLASLASLVGCYEPKIDGCNVDCALDGDCPDGMMCGAGNKCFPTDGSCDPPPLGELVKISAGGQHACAIGLGGGLVCWGSNEHGQIDGTKGPPALQPRPITVPGVTAWKEVDAGAFHTCAIGSDAGGNADVYCWGENSNSQCGTEGGLTPIATPTKVGIANPQLIGTGHAHSCAVDMENTVLCWGSNRLGQLGTTDVGGDRAEPMVVAGSYQGLAVGSETTCAFDVDHRVSCWGENTAGQLGNGAFDTSPMPHPTPSVVTGNVGGDGASPMVLSLGVETACAVDGFQLTCWGDNRSNQAGRDRNVSGNDILEIATFAEGSSNQLVRVAMGHDFGCAIDVAGLAMCWGLDDPRLGDADQNPRGGFFGPLSDRPVRAVGGGDLEAAFAIDAGGFRGAGEDGFACALFGTPEVGGVARCWGANDHGQLGDGTPSFVGTATAIDAPGPWTALRLGSRVGCAIAQDQTPYCWGDNFFRPIQPDDPQEAFFADPVAVNEGASAIDIAIGAQHVCALQTDANLNRAVSCWGSNGAHVLGNDIDTEVRGAPTISAKAYQTIHAGEFMTCVREDETSSECWGTAQWVPMGGSVTPISFDGVIEGPPGIGTQTMCTVINTRQLECRGIDGSGVRGDGTPFVTDFEMPSLVAVDDAGTPLPNVRVVADAEATANHRCAATDSNTFCWGSNSAGQVGAATTPTVEVMLFARPIDPQGEAFIVRTGASDLERVIAVGGAFTCAIESVGNAIHCWGANESLQCSTAGTDNNGTHTPITSTNTFISVAAGVATACGIADDLQVYCWGNSKHGETGTGISDRDHAVTVLAPN